MSKKNVQKDDREVIDFVKRNWESFARIAYEMYIWVGRLALLLNVEDMLRGNLKLLKLPNFSWVDLFDCTEEIEAQLKSYNPQNEVVILPKYPSGKRPCITIGTPSGRLSPLAACEEFYRNTHGPLDFKWLMTNDHQSELDRQDADKHRAEVRASLGPAIQDFLMNLARNREAFLAKGLGLDDLCPLDYLDCADIHVLLSTLKAGMIRIDDSDEISLWKPGPSWAKLEESLFRTRRDIGRCGLDCD